MKCCQAELLEEMDAMEKGDFDDEDLRPFLAPLNHLMSAQGYSMRLLVLSVMILLLRFESIGLQCGASLPGLTKFPRTSNLQALPSAERNPTYAQMHVFSYVTYAFRVA